MSRIVRGAVLMTAIPPSRMSETVIGRRGTGGGARAHSHAGGSGRCLELGIGSGRLALPLVTRGVEVWGVDASVAMVDQLRAKPGGADVPVAIGDMAVVDLSSLRGGDVVSFSVVYVAINTFF